MLTVRSFFVKKLICLLYLHNTLGSLACKFFKVYTHRLRFQTELTSHYK